MPDRQANRIVTDLLLDTDEIDFKAIWDEAETTALVDLEATLQNIVAHSAPETPAQKVKGAVKDTFKKISKAVWLNFLPARDEAELYEKTELHIHIKRSKQLQEVGENAKKLLDDIASISIAGFESSIQMLSKLEIDKKANTASEIAQQVAKESRETFGRTVKFFQENAEAYYATRSAEGEKQRKEIEKIVEKRNRKMLPCETQIKKRVDRARINVVLKCC
ncbi:MAG: hypothetical protein HC942_23120 [Microcoleus sp. SU_5_6]|nr:hypothetical protein [Microcoleus sp. SU_5_6]